MNTKLIWDILNSNLSDLARGKISEQQYRKFFGLPFEWSWKGPQERASWQKVQAARFLRSTDTFYVIGLLERLVRANAPLAPGLLAASEGAPSTWLAHTLHKLGRGLESGLSLPEAMRRQPSVFPAIQADLVEAGEKTGTLGPTLARMLDDMVSRRRVFIEIKSVMAYFAVVLLFAAVFTYFIGTEITPVFREINEEFEAGGIDAHQAVGAGHGAAAWRPYAFAEQIMAYSDLMAAFAAIVAVIVLLVVTTQVLVRFFGQSLGLRVLASRAGLRMPLVRRLVVSGNMAASTSMLSQLLEAGVPMDKALESVAHSGLNPSFAGAFMRMREKVLQGAPLAQAAQTENLLVPRFFGVTAANGEYGGNLPGAMRDLAEFYQARLMKQLKMIQPVLLPLLVIIIGVLVLAQSFSIFAGAINMSMRIMEAM